MHLYTRDVQCFDWSVLRTFDALFMDAQGHVCHTSSDGHMAINGHWPITHSICIDMDQFVGGRSFLKHHIARAEMLLDPPCLYRTVPEVWSYVCPLRGSFLQWEKRKTELQMSPISRHFRTIYSPSKNVGKETNLCILLGVKVGCSVCSV